MKFFKLVNKNWVETGSISRDYAFGNLDALAYKLGFTRIFSSTTRRPTYNFYYIADCARAKSPQAYSFRGRNNYLIDNGLAEEANYIYFSCDQNKLDNYSNVELKNKYGLARCEDCGRLVYYTDIKKVGRNHCYCSDCIENHAIRCDVCGRWYMKRTSITEYNLAEYVRAQRVCERCKPRFEASLVTCEDCGRLTRNAHFIRGARYCSQCAENHDVPNVICGYHDGRMPIQPQFASHETPRDDAFYCGEEIETECHEEHPKFIAYDVNLLMNEDTQLCKFERDGSLSNGFEIITQPCTLDWYYENAEKMQRLFKILNDNKCSHKNSSGYDTCGLHIHINRSFFKDYDYENRLCYLFQLLRDKIRIFSQRANFGYCQFASGSTTWSNIFNTKVSQMHGHNTALNVSNRNTIEFRIFRGTTDYKMFMACIEFTRNIATLVRDTTDISKIEATTFEDVVNYCDNRFLNDYCAQLGLLGGEC